MALRLEMSAECYSTLLIQEDMTVQRLLLKDFVKCFDFITCLCSHLVSKSLEDMQGEFETLLQLSAERRTELENQYNLYVFERESRDLQNWLLSRKTIAESDDFGQDLEGVEVRMPQNLFAKRAKTHYTILRLMQSLYIYIFLLNIVYLPSTWHFAL